MPNQRNANEIIAESLLAIEGRLVCIEKTLDDLKVVLEMLARYIMQEKDNAPKIDCTEEGDVRRRSWEVDTWHPEKGG